jgi:hypothetical protein
MGQAKYRFVALMYFLLYTGTEEVEGSTALSNLGGYDM